MANVSLQQFLFSYNKMLSYVEGNFAVGASGAVGTTKGSGVSSVTRLAAGTYRILLSAAWNRYLAGFITVQAPVTGSNVNDGSFVSGTTYQITAVGTTNWAAVGVLGTAASGVGFVATGVGGAGTGTAKAVATSNVLNWDIVGDPNTTINQQANPYIIIQCLKDDGTVADPVNGSNVGFSLMLRNSTTKGRGE